MKVVAIIIMVTFFGAFILKSVRLKKQGITADQMGKGTKDKYSRLLELWLKYAHFVVGICSLVSIILNLHPVSFAQQCIGTTIAFLGTLSFVLATAAMRDSWRAGIPTEDKTSLVTDGIFRISRNPAFLGFDCLYFGIAIAFPNLVQILLVWMPVVLLDLEIKQEEKFLLTTFGEEYQRYMQRVRRYLGRRHC